MDKGIILQSLSRSGFLITLLSFWFIFFSIILSTETPKAYNPILLLISIFCLMLFANLSTLQSNPSLRAYQILPITRESLVRTFWFESVIIPSFIIIANIFIGLILSNSFFQYFQTAALVACVCVFSICVFWIMSVLLLNRTQDLKRSVHAVQLGFAYAFSFLIYRYGLNEYTFLYLLPLTLLSLYISYRLSFRIASSRTREHNIPKYHRGRKLVSIWNEIQTNLIYRALFASISLPLCMFMFIYLLQSIGYLSDDERHPIPSHYSTIYIGYLLISLFAFGYVAMPALCTLRNLAILPTSRLQRFLTISILPVLVLTPFTLFVYMMLDNSVHSDQFTFSGSGLMVFFLLMIGLNLIAYNLFLYHYFAGFMCIMIGGQLLNMMMKEPVSHPSFIVMLCIIAFLNIVLALVCLWMNISKKRHTYSYNYEDYLRQIFKTSTPE